MPPKKTPTARPQANPVRLFLTLLPAGRYTDLVQAAKPSKVPKATPAAGSGGTGPSAGGAPSTGGAPAKTKGVRK
ncbi:hypothetical protein NMY22_g19000 [Coprinellus aureogranulatus]|nr:hypothetical protein NMY22_g19000 [Coprinellus aureogranulatus]